MPMGIVHDGEQAVGELLTGMFKGFPDYYQDHSDELPILSALIKPLLTPLKEVY